MENKDLLYGAVGLSVVVALIAMTYLERQPDPIVLNFSDAQPLSEEHQLVQDVLESPESSVLEQAVAFATAPAALPVLGQQLPAAWESLPAPMIGQVELSPSLQRSLAAGAKLRSESYTNPSSEFNRRQIEALRQIREKREH